MHVRPSRSSSLVVSVLVIAALVVVCCFATTARASTPPKKRSSIAGTWLGTYGGTYSGTFTLNWKLVGTRLVGTIKLSTAPGVSYGITGKDTRGAISFGVVKIGATYTGSVAGKTMSGHYKTPQGGGTWSAHKS